MVTGEDASKNEERIAQSKTLIIEGIAKDLGMTAKDIQKYLLDSLSKLGEHEVEILDIDMTHGPTSISVELLTKAMVDKIKVLNG